MTIQLVPSGNASGQDATQSAIQAITSETLDTDNKGLKIGTLSIQVNSASLNSDDATVRLQHSDDNSNYNNIDTADSTVGLMTLASGTAIQVLTPVTFLAMRYYRVVYTPNTNTAGTIQILANLL